MGKPMGQIWKDGSFRLCPYWIQDCNMMQSLRYDETGSNGKAWRETTSSHPERQKIMKLSAVQSSGPGSPGCQAVAFPREGMRVSGRQTEGFIPENLGRISALSKSGHGPHRAAVPGPGGAPRGTAAARAAAAWCSGSLAAFSMCSSRPRKRARHLSFLGFFPVSPQLC